MPETTTSGGESLRAPLSELKVNPGGHLETARLRRVLLTRRGRVVGKLVPLSEPRATPLKPLCGALRARLALAPDAADLTEPVEPHGRRSAERGGAGHLRDPLARGGPASAP